MVRAGALALATIVGATGLTVLTAPAAEAKVRRTTSDFDGDGFQDLVIGSPLANVRGQRRAGHLTVVYGSRDGLRAKRVQRLSRDSAIVPGKAAAGELFGSSFASGDFDADGFADLAVHLPDAVAGVPRAGWIGILYGSRQGLRAGVRFPNPMPRDSDGEPNRSFGTYLSAGNIDGRGPAELLVSGHQYDGVLWWYGWRPRTRTVPQHTRVNHPRGYVEGARLADVNGDGLADVVSYRSESVAVSLPTTGGPGPARKGPSFPSSPHTWDVGDLNGDGRADLVIGLPNSRKGGFRVVYGAANGFGRVQDISIKDRRLPGRSLYWEAFGTAVAVGDVNGDGYHDVVVADASGGRRGWAQSGTLMVLRGSPRGLLFAGASVITQDTPKVPGHSQPGNFFGHRLTLIDHNRDGEADLTARTIHGDEYRRDSVIVLRGSKQGPTGTGAVRLDGRSVGWPRGSAGGFANALLD